MPALALPDPPLSDGVIVLRGLAPGDADAIVAASQDPEIPRWTLVPTPYDAGHAREYLAYAAQSPAARTGVHLAIVARWAFSALAVERLELRAQAGNAASQAVARRAGFQEVEGPLLQRPECDGLPDMFFTRMRV